MKHSKLTYLLALLTVAYYGWFIFQSSFVIDGQRYFCLFDDAMISMAYAQNLAAGEGLVWYPGAERVEGFSNPLWVLFMASIHFLPMGRPMQSLVVQIFGGAFLLACGFIAAATLRVILGRRTPIGEASCFTLVTLNYPLVYWSLLGMEVSAAALLIATAIYMHVRAVRRGLFSNTPYIALGLAILLRLDLLVAGIGALIGFLYTDSRHWRQHVRHGVLILSSFLLLQILPRWIYFGELLPNTYFLKMAGHPIILRVKMGLQIVMAWIVAVGPLFLFAAGSACFFKKVRLVRAVFPATLLTLAYSVWVGGDAWEAWIITNRFKAVVWPLLCISAVVAVIAFSEQLKTKLPPSWAQHWAVRLVHGVVALAATFYFLLQTSFAGLPLPEATPPEATLRGATLREAISEMIHSKALTGNNEDNERNIRLIYEVAQITRPGAKYLVGAAGVPSYFSSERRFVDALGKADAHVARTNPIVPPLLSKFVFYRPGHTKWDYAYSIGIRKPDIILHFFYGKEEVKKEVEGKYVPFQTASGYWILIRKHSDKVRWHMIDTEHTLSDFAW